MRTWMIVAVLALAGCASSGEIRANAYGHARKAQTLEARGDYVGAARQREAAQKQMHKADARAEYERSGRIF